MTAYRLPNSVVHIPVVFMFVFSGVCIVKTSIQPMLAVFFLVSLYLARDLIILAYRNRGVPIVLWSMFVPFLYFHNEIEGFLVFNRQDSISVTLGLLAVFLIYVPVYIKKILKLS